LAGGKKPFQLPGGNLKDKSTSATLASGINGKSYYL
jgi:hypothetical protein